MGRVRRSWFLAPRAPRFDCAPGGYLGLGSIIQDPFRPDRPVTRAIPSPLPSTVTVESTKLTDWSELREKAKQGHIGVWVNFLQFVLDGDVSVKWMKENNAAFKFQSLETDWFLPTSEFVQAQMQLPLVDQHINAGSTRPDVYMITAIMVARGASLKQAKAHSGGFNFKMGPDLAVLGAPGVTLGPDIGISNSRKQEASGDATDFIFAYRLSKIQYQRKIFSPWKQVDVPSETPYEPRHGTAFSDEVEVVAQPKKVLDLASVEIAEGDVSSHELQLDDALRAVDDFDGEECECILPE